MSFNPFYILPELILTAGGILVLLAGLSTRKWEAPGKIKPYSPEALALLTLTGALASSLALLWRPEVVKGVSQFGDMIAVDPMAVFFKIVVLACSIFVVFLAADYFQGIRVHRGEFYALLIFATLAASFLSAATDLIMIYLSLEFLSITSYVLVGWLKQDPRSNEASVKYFLYGAVAAAVMVYGMSIFYGLAATTDIAAIHSKLVSYPPDGSPTHIIFLGLLMMMVGFGFKISMAPFHQWAPDTYEGAPTPVTAFLSVASKAAGFAVVLRVLVSVFTPGVVDWTPMIVALSGLTMTVGNLTALPQCNIKRMLAYSSIAQAGYLLLGVAALRLSPLALPAVMLYLFIYLFMNMGAFAVVTMVSARLNSDDIREYSGLAKRSPASAVAMAIFMLSLAGIPPAAGFVGKFYLFAAALQSGDKTLLYLAILAIANTVISVYYYMNVVRYMYFAKPKSDTPLKPSFAMNMVVGFAAAATIIMLISPEPFIQMAKHSAALLTGTP